MQIQITANQKLSPDWLATEVGFLLECSDTGFCFSQWSLQNVISIGKIYIAPNEIYSLEILVWRNIPLKSRLLKEILLKLKTLKIIAFLENFYLEFLSIASEYGNAN